MVLVLNISVLVLVLVLRKRVSNPTLTAAEVYWEKIQTDDGAVVAIVTADAGARVSVNEVMTGTVVMARL